MLIVDNQQEKDMDSQKMDMRIFRNIGMRIVRKVKI